MKLLKQFIQNRVFFFLDGQIYKVRENDFEKVDESVFSNAFLPIMIIAREHISENRKQYPVTDQSDLKAIVAQDKQDHTMAIVEDVVDNQTHMKFWQPDKAVLEKFEGKLCFWLPESILHNDLTAQCLYHIERLNKQLFSVNDGKGQFSANCTGPFQSPDYFLMSVGLVVSSRLSVSEQQYASIIHDGFLTLPSSILKSVFSAQNFLSKVASGFNWLSLSVGTITGIALFFGTQTLFLNNQIGALEGEIAQIDVKAQIATKQRILSTRDALEQFSLQEFKEPVEFKTWKVIGLLLNQGIGLERIRNLDDGVWLRLESEAATESLQFIRSLDMVESANIINAVSRVRGKQRFNVELIFKGAENGGVNIE